MLVEYQHVDPTVPLQHSFTEFPASQNLKKRAIAVSYPLFAAAYWICLILTSVGVHGRIIDLPFLEYRVDDPMIIAFLKYPLRAFVFSLPLLLTISLNTTWFSRLLCSRHAPLGRQAIGSACGLGAAILFFISFYSSLIIPWFAFILVYIFVLVYMLIITSFTSRIPREFIRACLSDDEFWVMYNVIFFVLVATIIPLVIRTVSGMYQIYGPENILQRWVVGIAPWAIPAALVMPVFPLAFEYFGCKNSDAFR